MTRYRSKPVEVEAMQWPTNGGNDRFTEGLAREIVAWVNDNGGEARYEPHSPVLPRIAIRTADGWVYAAPGDYVQKGIARFRSNRANYSGPWVIEFYVVHSPSKFRASVEWEQGDD